MKKTMYVFTFLAIILSSCSKGDDDALFEAKSKITVDAFFEDDVYKKVTVNLMDANTNKMIAFAVTTDEGMFKGRVHFIVSPGKYYLYGIYIDNRDNRRWEDQTEAFEITHNDNGKELFKVLILH